MTRKWFFEFLTHKKHSGHYKTIETCSTHREEHAGRWNFALASSEATLSAITGFRHFSALDLTSKVTGWPRTLGFYTNRFVSRRATRSCFSAKLNSIRGETARGSYQPPVCRGRMSNGLCRRGLRSYRSTRDLWGQVKCRKPVIADSFASIQFLYFVINPPLWLFIITCH